jgi:uncharacterized Ntn-hydrolase superfamily protein
MRGHRLLAALIAAAPASAQLRPVATYSIVARDSVTGDIGVAVQSHWFSVGSIVTWADAGVGAVATQSFAEPAYGPLGLQLMRMGRSGPEALRALVSTDKDSSLRQVAMVDAQGRVAAFTGNRAIRAAGHHVGAQYSVQANLMEKPSVWPAMARAYETTRGDLAERLLAALEAAEREGGDIRGRQSAAILVVTAKSTGKQWSDRKFDLRVEDHPSPVTELRRLVTLARVYQKMNEGDELVTKNDIAGAVGAYGQATSLVPDSATNGEAAFWTGISLANARRLREAVPYLARAYKADKRWAEVVRRLPAAGLIPNDPAIVERLVNAMKEGTP